MKTGIFVAGTLAGLAVAQPHQHRRHHHEARQVVDVVTDEVVVTATAPDVVVYVNEEGAPLYTSTMGQASATEAPAEASTWPTWGQSSWAAPSTYAASSSVAASSYVAPSPSTSETPAPAPTSSTSVYVAPPAPSTTEAPSSYAPASSSSAPAPSSSSSSGSSGSSGYGLSYSPYNSDSSCKTQDQVNTDFDMISGYGMIRIYGTDCNQVSTVLSAASAKGMKLFAGVFDITQVSSEIQTIIDAANGNWDSFDTISIGNEGVNDGTYTVSAVVAAIGTARSMLSSAGYTGKVVTVDTFVAIMANPALCQASDYAAANCHAFFDNTVTADQAGAYVLSQAEGVSQACGGMDTVITESGWPSQGEANGVAVPSESNQQAAISSLKSSFSSNIILFTAFNDMWKTNTAETFDAEQYWGIMGNAPS